MSGESGPEERAHQRLPLPLAQLDRRARNAKTALERHLTAFYLWEASLKLLGSAAVVEYARRPDPDPHLAERLQNLARPALGHWWELIRLLVPVLAERGDASFLRMRDLVLGRTRDDLPRTAGLDAALRQALGLPGGSRATVRLTELFDRLVQYRNKLLGHGATAALKDDFHQQMAGTLLAGAAKVLAKLDVLAGRRLLHIGEVRQVGGLWLVQRYELVGEAPQRLASLELPRSEAARLPDGNRLYLQAADGGDGAELVALHPLLLYDGEADSALFLDGRRGKSRTEYLCYTTGGVVERPDLGGERRELLARALGMSVVAEDQEQAWATRALEAEKDAAPAEEADKGPRRVGEFELLSELGRGGMGVVYRAWQPSLGRQVALKTLLQVGDVRSDARFRREIRALGKVDHPHLVKVHTSGSDGEHWFYAMELIEGVPLADVSGRLSRLPAGTTEVDLPAWMQAVSTACEQARKAEKPLSDPRPAAPPAPPAATEQQGEPGPGKQPVASRDYLRQMVELVRQASLAAHALHEAGVLHRDIKPGNIMVTADGGQAILMDLGLAQLADDVEGRLTRTRQFVGTLRYASPQQVLAVGALDRRSDVYGLGATLWELLALRPLFNATEQTPTPELMEKIQRDEPERLRRYAPAVGRDLEAIVHCCLEKDPKKRYASALELARDLGRFQAKEPIQARPVGQVERGLKWIRRRPTQAAAYGLALLVLFLGVGGGGAILLWRQAEAERQRAETAEQEMKDAHDHLAAALANVRTAQQGEQEAREQLARIAYADQINLAQRHWEAGDAGQARQQLEKSEPRFRGWEWRYLHHAFHPERHVFQGHAAPVLQAVFSPDGSRLASASEDHTIRLWDVAGGGAPAVLKGHEGWVLSVAFSPDGQRLASAGADKTVRLWDLAHGNKPTILGKHSGWVLSVAFSPDRRRLASSGEDRVVRLWDVAGGKELAVLKGHTGASGCVAFSPDGRSLASASDDTTVRLWDAASGKERAVLRGHAASVEALAFSLDSERAWPRPTETAPCACGTPTAKV